MTEEDEESIYAKIDEDDSLSDPSTPGSTAVDAPLIGNNLTSTLNKVSKYAQSIQYAVKLSPLQQVAEEYYLIKAGKSLSFCVPCEA